MSAVSFVQHAVNSYALLSTRNERLGYFGGTLASLIVGGSLASVSIITFKAALIVAVLPSAIAIVAYKILLSYQTENDFQQGKKNDHHVGQSLPFFEKAAHRGHKEAQYHAGLRYLWQSWYVQREQNQSIANDYFQKAASQGHLDALYELGEYHSKLAQNISSSSCLEDKSIQKKKEHTEAIRYFKQAADKGHLEALYCLGREYARRNEDEDKCNAITCYQQAADRGHVFAQCFLAKHYDVGDIVEKNTQKAFENYLKVADRDYSSLTSKEQGHCYFSAVSYVSCAYMTGTGVAQNLILAEKYKKLLHPVKP